MAAILTVPITPDDFSARLREFGDLPKGWLNGEGEALSSDGLDWLALRFEGCFPIDLMLPYLYPTEAGGVMAEWSLPPMDLSLEIDLMAHTAYWYHLNLDTRQDEDRTLDLDRDDAWEWVADRLRSPRFDGQ